MNFLSVSIEAIAQPVNIPDSALRSAVERELNKSAGETITQAEMAVETFTMFFGDGMNISDLTGLEYATNLEILFLQDNSITDITPLSSLTRLTNLYLTYNEISDISPLSNIAHIHTLLLGYNNITSLEVLPDLSSLQTLQLQFNQITSLEPLMNHTEYRNTEEESFFGYLDLEGNPLDDISVNTYLYTLHFERFIAAYFPIKYIKRISGNFQTTKTNTQLEPFVIEIGDRHNNKISNHPVKFVIYVGEGNFVNGINEDGIPIFKTYTDANGRASATFIAGSTAGTHIIHVHSEGTKGKSFTLIVEADPTNPIEVIKSQENITPIVNNVPIHQTELSRTLQIISGDNQNGNIDGVLAEPFVIEVKDGENPVPDVSVTFQVTNGAGVLDGATNTTKEKLTDSNGRSQVLLTLGPQIGTHTVSASVIGLDGETLTVNFNAEGVSTPTNVESANTFEESSTPHSDSAEGQNPNIPYSIIFNEIRNSTDDSQDWLEIKNISSDDISLREWEISIVRKSDVFVKEDKTIVQFPDYTLRAKSILLIVNTDPKNTALAVGKNIETPDTKQGGQHLYFLAPDMQLPNTNYLLILRSGRGKNGQSEAIVDVAGNYFITDSRLETEVWPLSSTTAPAEIPLFTENQAWQRTTTDKYGYFADAWKLSGYQAGIGYNPKASIRSCPGTPGYPAASLTYNLENGQISVSEIMFASKGGTESLPQWIELYNSSTTTAVNLKGWKLVVEAPTGETFHRYSEIELGTLNILPKQTVLLITGIGRSSVNLPDYRIYDLSHNHNDVFELGSHQNRILGVTGFALKLFSQNDTLVDMIGNMDCEYSSDIPSWKLPLGWTKEGKRTSLIRRYENGIPLIGTKLTSWVRASNIELVAYKYWGHSTDIGNPGYRRGGPLPVTLSHFRAKKMGNGVEIKWITESEQDNAGFNIWRSQTKQGPFVRINSTLIQGAGTTGERHNYSWTDTTAKQNVIYYYRIEDVSHAGVRQQLATTRLRGHVSANGKMTLPWGTLKAQEY